MIRLSIIVPAIGSQTELDDTLVSVLENRPSHCEVIVPCRREYLDPYDLQDEIVFSVCPRNANTVQLLNAGFQQSGGQIIHWLLPGTTATAGWTEPVLDRFDDSQDVHAVSPRLLDRRNTNRLVGVGVNLRRGARVVVGRRARFQDEKPWNVMGATLSAGFFRRSVLDAIGELRSDFGEELADVDWAAKLHAQQLNCQVEPECILLSKAERKTRLGFQIGRHLERLYWNYAVGDQGAGFSQHAFQVAVHTAWHAFHPAIITTLLGRFFGFVESMVRVKNIESEFTTTATTKMATRSRAA